MREIKFRVWNPHSKDMTSKYHALRTDGVLMSAASDEVYLETDLLATNETVMQFTGLKDKNGKEIYEGDIVWLENYAFQPDNGLSPKVLLEVRFDCGSWSTNQGLLADEEDVEVIGNIYESPDLLK